MKKIAAVVLLMFVAACAFGQAIPPINLNADLLLAGEVSLTWEPPPEGLVEDFNDGVANGFDYYTGTVWHVDDGYLKCDAWTDWKSAWYTGLDFDDFTLEGEFVNSVSTNSRGLLFRASGPQAAGYHGYSFYVAYNVINYAIYRYENGYLTLVHGWTPSGYINTGVGQSNRLKVVGSGSDFDLYINDNYVSSFTDATYPTGMVGAVASSQVEAWYDEINCLYGAVMVPDDERRVAEPGIACDEFGQPLAGEVSQPQPVIDTIPSVSENTREIDEFVEYRVYRDGTFVGATTTEAFTDYLPQPGEYEYTVTAYYDPEGESSPAGPELVVWEPVVLTLTGQVTIVPPQGGLIYYDVSVLNTLPQTFPNVNWWTSVILPNGQAFGPLAFQTVTIPGFLDVTIQGLNQNVPDLAPAGVYSFIGHLGFYPNSIISDSFVFEKQGGAADAIDFDPTDWVPGSELTLAADGETPVSVPSAYALSDAYPNPFNPSTSFSVSLPESAELTVTVYNIAGQRVATLADGQTGAGQYEFTFHASDLASGLYFIRAFVPGELDQIRKVTLIR